MRQTTSGREEGAWKRIEEGNEKKRRKKRADERTKDEERKEEGMMH